MSAHDTFEWYVSTQAPGKTAGTAKFIREQREYLFTLRSEDERQRFVEWAMEELRRRSDGEKTGRTQKKSG